MDEKIMAMLEKMDAKIDALQAEMTDLKTQVNCADNRLAEVEKKVNSLDSKLSNVQITIENEIARKIQIIAEGHMETQRKLSLNQQSADKLGNVSEEIGLRLVSLESDMKIVKKALQLA